ncbi:carboxymuconolactone decarboxylase family protein [Microbispora sp. GKU 823]|uniref:carboxymuconolactone decarboxylase family protein n=1 Tax=Microbispora sp. GKU 823 TaxID=1652100 RepID=UPI001C4E0035|nr:carboxymuconolactone decarboxylase family protein [Microbispora sp. GKU 823]
MGAASSRRTDPALLPPEYAGPPLAVPGPARNAFRRTTTGAAAPGRIGPHDSTTDEETEMPTPYRYVTPVPTEVAAGLTAEVYAQIARDFGMARMPLFLTLSPAPEVLAPTWAMLRESLLAGRAPRAAKEVVAAGVSLANKCPFCVDAHTVLLHATGEHDLAETVARGRTPSDPEHARLFAWATGTATAGQAPPCPPGHAAEHIGTALAFHFINRMVSSLLTDNLLPAGLQRSRLVRGLGGRPSPGRYAAGCRGARRCRCCVGCRRARPRRGRREPRPGPRSPRCGPRRERGPPCWATRPGRRSWRPSRPGTASTLRCPAGRPVRWRTSRRGQRPAARLALLAALAPYRVTDADVAAWREAGGGRYDADLVRLLAFGAITAVRRIEAALAVPA